MNNITKINNILNLYVSNERINTYKNIKARFFYWLVLFNIKPITLKELKQLEKKNIIAFNFIKEMGYVENNTNIKNDLDLFFIDINKKEGL
jgi:hypothetical protein